MLSHPNNFCSGLFGIEVVVQRTVSTLGRDSGAHHMDIGFIGRARISFMLTNGPLFRLASYEKALAMPKENPAFEML
jgi:hypothetical protein